MIFDFGINFEKVIKEHLASFLHGPKRLNRLKAMIKPFQIMYDEFHILRTEYAYKCTFNGSVIYLETALNDRFDPINREIYIDKSDNPKLYIYRKSELKPDMIMYRKWNAATPYNVGKFAWYQGKVYSANSPNTGKVPGVDPEWTYEPTRSAPILRRKSEYNGTISFVVYVKSTLVYNQNEMKSLIDYYKMAGRGYTIKPY